MSKTQKFQSFVIMENALRKSGDLKIHEKYDLKGAPQRVVDYLWS